MNQNNVHESETYQNSSTQVFSEQPVEQPKPGFWSEIIKFTIVALAIIMPIRLFIAQPFIVSGASMETTFDTGQYLIVDQLSYHFEKPARGQVVIFKYPKDESKYFIKRIIGLPGEKVELHGTSVIIYNKDHPEGFTLKEPYVLPGNQMENNMTVTLPDNQYFVMGDNRLQSSDSRAWGNVPASLIIGTPFLRLFPLTTIGVFPGNYKETK